MRRTRRSAGIAAIAVSLALGASGCHTIGTAGRTVGEAAGDTAEKAGDTAATAVRGAGRVIDKTARAGSREIHDND